MKLSTKLNKQELIIIALIFFFASALSLFSFLYFYNHGLTIAYSDAKAHLNIARRVFDNVTPGMAQLGGIWLPLLHLLMLSTIWNDFMWHSGISGSIINMFAFITSVYFIYKLTFEITNKKINALIATLIFGLNVNILYLQSTPMTESLFVCTLTIGVYYLTLWSKHNRLDYVILSAFFFLLTSFNRYEGWPVILCAGFVILIIGIIKKRLKKTESTLLIFIFLACFGIFTWLIWQTAIFHNPLYFLNSEFSAKAQTEFSIAEGNAPAYKNMFNAIKTYFYSMVHVNGFIDTILVGLGLVSFSGIVIFKFLKKKDISKYLPVFVLAVPGVFLIYSLYSGHIPVDVPEIHEPSHIFFNVRYAIYSLPLICVILASLSTNKVMQFIIVSLTLFNSYILFTSATPATVLDATGGKSFTIDEYYKNWIGKYYKGGYILASAGTSDPIMFMSGLDMKDFITEGSNKYWTDSIQNPKKYANIMILSSSPKDSIKMHFDMKKVMKDFKPVSTYNGFELYERIE